jgi:hypothetical protein
VDKVGQGVETDDQADFSPGVGECVEDEETVEEVDCTIQHMELVCATDCGDAMVCVKYYDGGDGAFKGSVEVKIRE